MSIHFRASQTVRAAVRRTIVGALAATAVAGTLVLAGCGGGGGSAPSPGNPTPIGPTPIPTAAPTATPVGSTPTPAPTATPIGTPTPTPSPVSSTAPGAAPVIAQPSSVSFLAAGSAAAQNVTVTQTNNTTGFSLTSANCSGVAAVSPASGTGPFKITPVAAGKCSYTATGNGADTTISITVTTTTVGSH